MMLLDVVIRCVLREVRKVNHEELLKNVLEENASIVVKACNLIDQERILQVSGRGPRGEGLEPSLFQVVGFCLPSALTSYPASHLAPGVPCGLDSTHSAGTWHSPLGAAGCEEPCLFSPSSQQHYKSMEQKPSLPLSSEPAVVAP